ncbi:MAG TPA: aminoglycoside phosphotransferase family protein [Roseiflexaceae bacterium]|nr:aminoglycoside phosphotransferase family protein [Roseiflexaceae bacterium]
MPLTREQLNAILYETFPGTALKDMRQIGVARYALVLSDGEQLSLQLYNTAAEASNAAAALSKLRAEIDLPIPLLHASDTNGALVGQPYLLTSHVDGDPLGAVLPRMSDEQLYVVGRRLGEVIGRIHRIAIDGYGNVAGDAALLDDEQAYIHQRVEQNAELCVRLGLLSTEAADEVQQWFAHNFVPVSRTSCLLHGNLGLRTILLRTTAGGWQLSGLIDWERALGWSPAWEHAVFLDAIDGPRFFGLRVGYGTAYDEQTRRAYEQVREHVLLPYRMLLALQRMHETYQAGEYAESARYGNALLNRVRALIPM